LKRQSVAKQVRPSISGVVQNKGKWQKKRRGKEQRGRSAIVHLNLDIGFPNVLETLSKSLSTADILVVEDEGIPGQPQSS